MKSGDKKRVGGGVKKKKERGPYACRGRIDRYRIVLKWSGKKPSN